MSLPEYTQESKQFEFEVTGKCVQYWYFAKENTSVVYTRSIRGIAEFLLNEH